jgi:hypothetical protein
MVSASDVVLAATALLDVQIVNNSDVANIVTNVTPKNERLTSSFNDAYDSLGIKSEHLLKKGIDLSIATQMVGF